MRKEDLRRKRTKNALKKAIAKLLDKNSIEKISVIDICEEAKINRVTFYTHYKDKYEFLVNGEKQEIETAKENKSLNANNEMNFEDLDMIKELRKE